LGGLWGGYWGVGFFEVIFAESFSGYTLGEGYGGLLPERDLGLALVLSSLVWSALES
jgi:hypothetical protein